MKKKVLFAAAFMLATVGAFFKVVLTGLESGMPCAIGFIYKNES